VWFVFLVFVVEKLSSVGLLSVVDRFQECQNTVHEALCGKHYTNVAC